MIQVVAQILPFIRRSNVFAPDVALAMGEAYDKAIGTVYPDAESRIVVRELIAKRVIRMAQKGVVDRDQLCHIIDSDDHSFWRFRIGSRVTSFMAGAGNELRRAVA